MKYSLSTHVLSSWEGYMVLLLLLSEIAQGNHQNI